ncbi:acyltransferase [Hyphomicrobiaceae bacterium 22]|uniref:Acyltransferase n=1 Tax=Prosthecodimorpha staleyi TaxID=2840188 RepID=A0A947GDZ0_9HYPH|nr:acyltransferase [Prosthecodimorpha staleyi]
MLHMNNYLVGGPLMESGYLAVDLFFIISGFVNSHALSRMIEATGSTRGFLRARLRRLYPLFALGLALGFSIELAKALAAAEPGRAATKAVSELAVSMLGVPDVRETMVVPLNPVFWSLILEALAYWLHGHVLWSIPATRLRIGLGIGLAGLVGIAFGMGSLDLGANRETFALATYRIAFGYAAGMLLYRLFQAGRLPRLETGGALIALSALAVFASPVAPGLRPVYDLIAVALIFPVLVAGAAETDLDGALRGPVLWAGRLSYALYALHVPILFLVVFVVRITIGRAVAIAPDAMLGLAFMATLTLVTILASGFNRRLAAGSAGIEPALASSRGVGGAGRS